MEYNSEKSNGVSGCGYIPILKTAEFPNNVWEVVAGKSIAPSLVTGIERVFVSNLSNHYISYVDDLMAPTGLSDGVGVAVNVTTGRYSLVWNGNPSPVNHDLWFGQIFLALNSITFAESSAEDARTQKFIIPTYAY